MALRATATTKVLLGMIRSSPFPPWKRKLVKFPSGFASQIKHRQHDPQWLLRTEGRVSPLPRPPPILLLMTRTVLNSNERMNRGSTAKACVSFVTLL